MRARRIARLRHVNKEVKGLKESDVIVPVSTSLGFYHAAYLMGCHLMLKECVAAVVVKFISERILFDY